MSYIKESGIQELRRELLKAIRGRMPQSRLSRKLGYSYNQVYRWETGLTEIKWSSFILLMEKRGLSPKAVFKGLTGIEDCGAWQAVQAMLKGANSLERLSAETGVKVQKLRRWSRGDAAPGLAEALSLIMKRYSKCLELFEALLGGFQLPCLAKAYGARDRSLKISYEFPYAAAALGAMETPAYVEASAPGTAWLADRLRVPVAEMTSALLRMTEAGLVRKKGAKFVRRPAVHINVGKDRVLSKQIQAFWLNRAAESARSDLSRDVFAYAAMTLDDAAFQEIRGAAVRFYEEVAGIASGKMTKGKRIVVMNFCFQDLG